MSHDGHLAASGMPAWLSFDDQISEMPVTAEFTAYSIYMPCALQHWYSSTSADVQDKHSILRHVIGRLDIRQRQAAARRSWSVVWSVGCHKTLLAAHTPLAVAA
jgi:hypothetical protein